MNSSGNLISLSDSGVGPSLSGSRSSNSAMGCEERTCNSLISDANFSSTGLLVDLTDTVPCPFPSALMTLAEVDDTFGIFSKAQTCTQNKVAPCDEATSLVRSFTNGRKSDTIISTIEEEPLAPELEPELQQANAQCQEKPENDTSNAHNSLERSNDSNCTMITCKTSLSLEFLSPGSDFEIMDGDEQGISDEKMDAILTESGASDSDILDINNLSSFSIPDTEQDEQVYLSNFKREFAGNDVSEYIVREIKSELLHLDRPNGLHDRTSTGSGFHVETSRPSYASSGSQLNSRLSVTSTVSAPSSTRSRLSSISAISDVDPPVPVGRSALPRLSGIYGSPIRASYPVSKYYMPTPKAQTPERTSTRDKILGSYYTPGSTTRIVATGDLNSPYQRMPVRKSISAETLHYERTPSKVFTGQVPKFSTPTARRSSYSIQSRFTQYAGAEFVHYGSQYGIEGAHAIASHQFAVNEESLCGHLGRLSIGSTISNASMNTSFTSSSSTSTVYRSDISSIAHNMKQMKLNETLTKPSKPIPQQRQQNTGFTKPMRATVAIESSKSYSLKPEIKRTQNVLKTNSTSAKSFVPPIAASSPKISPSPARANNMTTPTRSRYGNNVRSSGYGPQSLNCSIAGKTPLTSPNVKIPTASGTTFKSMPVPKTLKASLNFTQTIEVGRPGSGALPSAVGKSRPSNLNGPNAPGSIKPPMLGGNLRRPPTVPSNKENNLTTGIRSKYGIPRPRQ